MENKKTNKLILILDYMKKTFSYFTSNKKVILPIIYYTISKTLIGIIFFITLIPAKNQIISILEKAPIRDLDNIDPTFFEPIKNTLMSFPLFTLILFVIVATFGYTWLEAKIFTSIAREMPFTLPKKKSTFRTFFAFLVANIIIYTSWLVIFIPYLIVGAVTLTLGFTLIPFIIDILLMYYKGIYVVTEHGIFASLVESIKFSWQHFVLSMILQIFILISDITKIVNSGGNVTKINQIINFSVNLFDIDSSNIENMNRINSIEQGISPSEIFTELKMLEIATNILIPIAIVLLIGSAVVFFIRSVVLAYFAFTSTYIYCDTTAAEHLLTGIAKEISNEDI